MTVPQLKLSTWRSLYSAVRFAAPLAFRKWWLTKTWPVQLKLGQLKCAFNSHDFMEAPALDKNGDIDLTKPGRYQRCKRPKCQLFAGKPALLVADKWAELDTVMVICRTNCPKCYGRGFTGKMLLDKAGSAKAAIPCPCIRVQPAYCEKVRA